MDSTLVKCACHECGEHIAFEKQHEGVQIDCPHCGEKTLLRIPLARIEARPEWEQESSRRRRSRVKRIAANVALAILGIISFSLLATRRPDLLQGLCIIAVGACIYFIPAACGRKKQNASAIFLLNLFLGWTFVGWVVALVWAKTKDPEPAK